MIFDPPPTNTKTVSNEAIEKILSTLDPDLAAIVVCSAVSMKLDDLLKTLITVSDISYYRHMRRDMNIQPASGELSALEIRSLLKLDGWIVD